MRSFLILTLFLSGCGTALLPRLEPHVSMYETQRARWALELAQASDGSTSPDVAPPKPTVPVGKCDCPSVCARDAAFPCDCTASPCTNPNCRRSVKRDELAESLILIPATNPPDAVEMWKTTLPLNTLVVCTRPNCAPCRQVAQRVVSNLVFMGWLVTYIDVERSPELAERLNVTTTPTLIGISDGKEVGRYEGDRYGSEEAWRVITGWFKVPYQSGRFGTTVPSPPVE